MRTKTCTKCHTEKTLDRFYSNSRNKTDGRMSACKLCHRRLYPSNVEKLRVTMLAWRNKNREHYRQYQREYQRERKRKQAWSEANLAAQQNVDSA
jgi:hypothetical protein